MIPMHKCLTYIVTLPFLLLLFLALACRSEAGPQAVSQRDELLGLRRPEVDTFRVSRVSFEKEIYSQGKLRAYRAASLQFSLGGRIERIAVKNGQEIRKGQFIAGLNTEAVVLAEESAREMLEKERLSFADALLNYGYDSLDSAKVPRQIWKAARYSSGLAQAEMELKKARFRLKQSNLLAPFSGTIAQLNTQPFSPTSANKAFCLLLDYSKFLIDFEILESEISYLAPGQEVNVIPYAFPEKNIKGSIVEIDPSINKDGNLQVKALIPKPGPHLIHGMNAKVIIKNQSSPQLAVPSSALLRRQGKDLVFLWKNDTAYWNYVEPGQRNSEWISIKSGIEEGDVVISSGNRNLAHRVAVLIPQP